MNLIYSISSEICHNPYYLFHNLLIGHEPTIWNTVTQSKNANGEFEDVIKDGKVNK